MTSKNRRRLAIIISTAALSLLPAVSATAATTSPAPAPITTTKQLDRGGMVSPMGFADIFGCNKGQSHFWCR